MSDLEGHSLTQGHRIESFNMPCIASSLLHSLYSKSGKILAGEGVVGVEPPSLGSWERGDPTVNT